MKKTQNLEDRVINVNGMKYTVLEHKEDYKDKVEILVLARGIEEPKEITDIKELGYDNWEAVRFSSSAMDTAKIMLSNKAGSDVVVAAVTSDGTLLKKTLTIKGLDFLDPTRVHVVFKDNPTDMSVEDLCISLLLYREWQAKNMSRREPEPESEPESTNTDENWDVEETLSYIFDSLLKKFPQS